MSCLLCGHKGNKVKPTRTRETTINRVDALLDCKSLRILLQKHAPLYVILFCICNVYWRLVMLLVHQPFCRYSCFGMKFGLFVHLNVFTLYSRSQSLLMHPKWAFPNWTGSNCDIVAINHSQYYDNRFMM